MMSKKLPFTFKAVVILFLLTSFLKAEIKNPNSTILPAEVIKIQLDGLMNNDKDFTDSGIEQTWNFAHPANKQVTGPLPRFKTMLKGKSYSMMIDHLEHTVTQLAFGDNWAQFEVIILGKDKNYHKFNWQVEKLTLKDHSMIAGSRPWCPNLYL